MDTEITFGEVEQAPLARRRRPDRNQQYAVVTYGTPRDADLPVFVELDALRDIELHAGSNTRVELGGVLLGGQYEDDEGRPYVLVADSLRAEHCEATRGSFKFTHETWAEITRQRAGFPDDLQMVGWYHTHPDWGVFLSGMDLFICEHFFNKPLDVALVVDPCRQDRGWFQWTMGAEGGVRQMAGFYLVASRHRQAELEWFLAQLQGRWTMAPDPRFVGVSGPAAYPPPVIHVVEPRSPWQPLAVLGMLTMQFLFLALVAWKLLTPPEPPATPPQAERLAAAVERDARSAALDRQARELDAQQRVLDQVIHELGQGRAEGVVRSLQEKQQESERLQQDARVYRGLEEKLRREHEELQNQLEQAGRDKTSLTEKLERVEASLTEARRSERALQAEVAAVRKELKELDAHSEAPPADPTVWLWGGAIAVAILAGVGLAGAALCRRRRSAVSEAASYDAGTDQAETPATHSRPPST